MRRGRCARYRDDAGAGCWSGCCCSRPRWPAARSRAGAAGPDPLIALADAARADAALAAAAITADPGAGRRGCSRWSTPAPSTRPRWTPRWLRRLGRTAADRFGDRRPDRPPDPPVDLAQLRAAAARPPPSAAAAVALDLPADRVGLVASVAACCAGVRDGAGVTTRCPPGSDRRSAVEALQDALATEHAALWCYALAVAFLPADSWRRPGPTRPRTGSCAARSSSTLDAGRAAAGLRPARLRDPAAGGRRAVGGRRCWSWPRPTGWPRGSRCWSTPPTARCARPALTALTDGHAALRPLAGGRRHPARHPAVPGPPLTRRSSVRASPGPGRGRSRCCRGGTPAGRRRPGRLATTPAAASRSTASGRRTATIAEPAGASPRRRAEPVGQPDAVRPHRGAVQAGEPGQRHRRTDVAVPGRRRVQRPRRRAPAAAAARRRWSSGPRPAYQPACVRHELAAPGRTAIQAAPRGLSSHL